MTDQLTDRLRSAADDAMRGVLLDDPRTTPASIAPPGTPRPSRRRWLTASAVLVAAAVIGVVVWAGSSRSSDPVAPPPTTTITSTPKEQLAAAVVATQSADSWSADREGPVGSASYTYEAPDRLEVREVDSTGAPLRASVVVGDEVYATDDGGWVVQTTGVGETQSLRIGFIDMLSTAPCAIEVDGAIVAWSVPTPGCDETTATPPVGLPSGALLWRVDLADGRLSSVEYGEASGNPSVTPAGATSDSIWERAGAPRLTTMSYDYLGAPSVTVPTDFVDLRGGG